MKAFIFLLCWNNPVSLTVNCWLSRLNPIQGFHLKIVAIRKKKKKRKKFGHPIHIPYDAKWKSSESNDTVSVQHFYLPNWQV